MVWCSPWCRRASISSRCDPTRHCASKVLEAKRNQPTRRLRLETWTPPSWPKLHDTKGLKDTDLEEPSCWTPRSGIASAKLRPMKSCGSQNPCICKLSGGTGFLLNHLLNEQQQKVIHIFCPHGNRNVPKLKRHSPSVGISVGRVPQTKQKHGSQLQPNNGPTSQGYIQWFQIAGNPWF